MFTGLAEPGGAGPAGAERWKPSRGRGLGTAGESDTVLTPLAQVRSRWSRTIRLLVSADVCRHIEAELVASTAITDLGTSTRCPATRPVQAWLAGKTQMIAAID
jgi:hypothetical protein